MSVFHAPQDAIQRPKGKRRMKNITRRLLTALLPVALLALFAPTVLAANWPQDGTDPYGTGCARSSWPVYSVSAGSGTLTLKFSNNCATAWGEFTWPWWVVPYATTIHTPQLFDGYGYWVDTCVQGYWGGALTCTGGY
jgi:Protein of unknown function (DUF2690)